jgi:YbbR-like protein
MPGQSKPSWFARTWIVLSQNFGLKVLSLLCALIVFGLVHGTSEVQRTVVVGVVGVMPLAGTNRVLVRPLIPSVRVTIRGAKSVLDDLKADDLGTLQLDLRDAPPHVVLDANMVHAPTGVRVEQLDPPALDLGWEQQTSRDVPLNVSLMGTPAAGYVVRGAVQLSASTVKAYGPESAVAVLQSVRVAALDVAGLAQGQHTRTLAIDKPPIGVRFDRELVSAKIEVSKEIAERPFPKLKVHVVGPAAARAIPNEVDVRLRCAPEYVTALRAELVVAQVTIDSKEPHGSVLAPVQIGLAACEATVVPESVIVQW